MTLSGCGRSQVLALNRIVETVARAATLKGKACPAVKLLLPRDACARLDARDALFLIESATGVFVSARRLRRARLRRARRAGVVAQISLSTRPAVAAWTAKFVEGLCVVTIHAGVLEDQKLAARLVLHNGHSA